MNLEVGLHASQVSQLAIASRGRQWSAAITSTAGFKTRWRCADVEEHRRDNYTHTHKISRRRCRLKICRRERSRKTPTWRSHNSRCHCHLKMNILPTAPNCDKTDDVFSCNSLLHDHQYWYRHMWITNQISEENLKNNAHWLFIRVFSFTLIV